MFRQFKLLINLPFLKKGKEFVFDDETGYVYAILDGKQSDIPLRRGLAGYLWLLMTEKKYLKRIDA